MDSHERNPEKYNGLDDVMRGYIYAGDYAIMQGSGKLILLPERLDLFQPLFDCGFLSLGSRLIIGFAF